MKIVILQMNDGRWTYCPESARHEINTEVADDDTHFATAQDALEAAKADQSIPRGATFVVEAARVGLPPDPDCQNAERAAWAHVAIRAFEGVTGADDGIETVGDLLCDLMHWCDRHGVDFKDALASAQSNYRDETAA